MERRQAYKFELMPNGEQQRQMRRYAGSVRFIYNKALALQKEMYETTGRSHTGFQLDKLLTLCIQGIRPEDNHVRPTEQPHSLAEDRLGSLSQEP